MLEFIMLGLLTIIYTKKYWMKLIGVKMSCAKNNIIENRKKISIIFWIIIILFIGMALYIIYNAYNLFNVDNKTEVGLGLISIGLGLISIGGIIYSIKTSYSNDTKMIQNENVKFQRILHDFETERMYFIRGIYNREAYIWRSRTQLERAYELDKKIIKCKHHYRLIQYFIVTFDVLFNSENYNDLADNQQKSVKEMYRMAREFDRSGVRQETNFLNILSRMGKNTNESEQQFYNRLFD